LAVALSGAGHGYGGHPVLAGVDLAIERGDRVALVGANGAGKSTLMRLLAGVETPLAGDREEGAELALAYFAQDQAQTLDPQLTVLEQITRVAPFTMVPRLRNLLGAFLFHGDDVHKRVAVLSGGERNRLALAILLLRPANLLLLDEPTNHLDLASKEVLLAALHNYRGTLVFVSHDRYFVDALATRVVEVAHGTATAHLGNYEDFLRAKHAAGDRSHSQLRVEQAGTTPSAGASGGERADRLQAHATRKSARRDNQRRERQMAEIEAQIGDIERQLAALDGLLHDPALASDHAQLATLAERQAALQADHDACYQRWLALHEQSEATG
jgi:ATP-binding cassette subfamily F protein 3